MDEQGIIGRRLGGPGPDIVRGSVIGRLRNGGQAARALPLDRPILTNAPPALPSSRRKAGGWRPGVVSVLALHGRGRPRTLSQPAL